MIQFIQKRTIWLGGGSEVKKHRWMLMIIVAGTLNFMGCKKELTRMDVVYSHSIIADNWYSEHIAVLVDEKEAENREACCRKIIQNVIENNFPSVDFSFDETGYPNELSVSVHLSKSDSACRDDIFEFDYMTDLHVKKGIQSNIKDNPEDYRIKYRNE